VALLAFGGYMVCLLVGVAFYLAALGPGLNLAGFTSITGRRQKPSSASPAGHAPPASEATSAEGAKQQAASAAGTSTDVPRAATRVDAASQGTAARSAVTGGSVPTLLFYHAIATLTEEEWARFWEDAGGAVVIRDKRTHNLIDEAHPIAVTAHDKYIWMSYGSFSFRLTLFFFIWVVDSLYFPYSVSTVFIITLSGCALIAAAFAIVGRKRGREPSSRAAVWWGAAAIGFALLAVVFATLKIAAAVV
jgi:hypothetical protein